MSMPQSGPPDPNTPGPVSGGPQTPYDPQAAPPPHQPGPPPAQQPGLPPPQQPPSFTKPAAPARPAALMLGGIGVGVLALLFLIRAVIVFLDIETDYGVGPMGATFVYAGYFLAMVLAAAAAAVLAMTGNDFGRIFASAVAGAAMWEAAVWWQSLIAPIVTGHGVDVDHFNWFPGIVAILGGFVGIAVVAAMAVPAISTYAAEKRKKPAPGAPPPGGPGMPPSGAPGMAPPGQQPGGPGMAPPPGQQPGAPGMAPPPGQQPSAPGTAPPPGAGAPPPAGPAPHTEPPQGPGAPPPAGPSPY